MNAPAMLRKQPRKASYPRFRMIVEKQPVVPCYYPGEPHRCQTCGNGGFNVGRTTAECSNCGRPMLLAHRER